MQYMIYMLLSVPDANVGGRVYGGNVSNLLSSTGPGSTGEKGWMGLKCMLVIGELECVIAA